MKTKHSRLKVVLIATLAAVLSLTTIAQAQKLFRFAIVPTYTLTDLGANAGDSTWSFGNSINNVGEAVGEYEFWTTMWTPTGRQPVWVQRGFRTLANQPFVTGTDDFGPLAGDLRTAAFAINGNGVMVGDSTTIAGIVDFSAPTGTPSHAIRRLSRTAFVENLFNASNVDRWYARGLDSASRTVGYFKEIGSPNSHAMFSNSAPLVTILDAALNFPLQSEAYSLNSSTQIVGWRQVSMSSQPRAFLLRPNGSTINGGILWAAPEDIVLPAGTSSKAFAINENSQVVGQSGTAGGLQHAFLFQDTNFNGVQDINEIRDLDTAGTNMSGARSINFGGTAVGYFGGDPAVMGDSHAGIFILNGPMVDLNILIPAGTGRWTLRLATAINDNGQIVGYMEDQDPDKGARVRHAFRLDVSGTRLIIW